MARCTFQACLFALLAWLGPAAAASCGELRLEPVSLLLRPGDDSASLWLSNTGQVPLHAQVRLFSWTQDQGGEVLQPTRELAISPPLLAVPPQGRQRVRLVRLAPDTDTAETAYRLVVDELPPPAATGTPAAAPRLRYSIPVFVLPPGPAAGARLDARIEADRSGRRRLRLDNSGDRHARIAGLALIGAGGRRHLLAPGLAGYVLAGRHKHWPLPDDLDLPPHGRFEADVNGEAVVLVPEPAPEPPSGR